MKTKQRGKLKDFKAEHPLTPDECFKKPKYSKDYQMGVLVGQQVVHKLPTLSTDGLKTFNVIEVPESLTELWEKKNKEYNTLKFETKESTKKFYENLKWYKANLETVYLPKEVEFIVYDFYEDKFSKDMVKGLDDAIWDCDLSHYVFSSAKIGDITSTLEIKMKYNE
jgi:hypothetical protein